MEFFNIAKSFFLCTFWPWSTLFIGLILFLFRSKISQKILIPSIFLVLNFFVFSLAGPVYLYTRPGFIDYLKLTKNFDFQRVKITPWQLAQLGHIGNLDNNSKYSFLSHNQKKDKNIFRIGLFGDLDNLVLRASSSDELAKHLAHDLPKMGNKKVEVINFGVSGFGFIQSFLMWQYIGINFNLDLCIFIPNKQKINRDLNFTSTSKNDFAIPHARYIFDQRTDKLKLLTLKNNDPKTILDFYSPWGSYISWKYEYDKPYFWRRILPLKDKDQADVNLLFSIYAKLLNTVASKVRTLVYLHPYDAINFSPLHLSPKVEILISRSENFISGIKSWFLTNQEHYSSFGQQLLAQELANWISSKQISSIQDLNKNILKEYPREGRNKVKLNFKSIQNIDSLSLSLIKNEKMGHLAQLQPVIKPQKFNEIDKKKPIKLQPIITIFPPEVFGDLTVIDFSPEEFKVNNGRNYLWLKDDNGDKKKKLGQLQQLSDQIFLVKMKARPKLGHLQKGKLWLNKIPLGQYSWESVREKKITPLNRRSFIFRSRPGSNFHSIQIPNSRSVNQVELWATLDNKIEKIPLYK